MKLPKTTITVMLLGLLTGIPAAYAFDNDDHDRPRATEDRDHDAARRHRDDEYPRAHDDRDRRFEHEYRDHYERERREHEYRDDDDHNRREAERREHAGPVVGGEHHEEVMEHAAPEKRKDKKHTLLGRLEKDKRHAGKTVERDKRHQLKETEREKRKAEKSVKEEVREGPPLPGVR